MNDQLQPRKRQTELMQKIFGFDPTVVRVRAETVREGLKPTVTGYVSRWEFDVGAGKNLAFDSIYVHRDDVPLTTDGRGRVTDNRPVQVEVKPGSIDKAREEESS